MPSRRASTSATRSICSRSCAGETSLPKPCEAEWSVIARYSYPSSRAACAISSIVALPSEATVWQCRSPRMSPSSIRGQPSPSSAPRLLRRARAAPDCATNRPAPARRLCRNGPIQAPPRARLQLAAVLPQLRLDVGEAQQPVHLGLRRARPRGPVGVVLDAVLGDVQPAAHRELAQRGVVRGGAREVLQQVPQLLRGRDPQVHARGPSACGPGRRPAHGGRRARSAPGTPAPPRAAPAPRSPRRGRCPSRCPPPAAPSPRAARARPAGRARAGPRPAPPPARSPPAAAPAAVREPAGSSIGTSLRGQLLQRREHFRLELRPEPPHRAQPLRQRRLAQRLQASRRRAARAAAAPASGRGRGCA